MGPAASGAQASHHGHGTNGTAAGRDPHGRTLVRLRRARADDAPLLRTWEQDPDVIAADAAWEALDDHWDWDEELTRSPTWRDQFIIDEVVTGRTHERGRHGDGDPGVDGLDAGPGRSGPGRSGPGLSVPDVEPDSDHGRPVGFVQVIDPADEESHYWGPVGRGHRAIDIWIGSPADRGRGLGAAAMRLALERCAVDPEVHTVLIDPLATNTRAIAFYERLGFEHVDHEHEAGAPRPADAAAIVMRYRLPGPHRGPRDR